MKKTIAMTSIVCILIFALSIGCKRNHLDSSHPSVSTNPNPNSFSKLIKETSWSLFDLPEGAVTSITGNTITIDLPEPYVAVAVDSAGNYAYSVAGGQAKVTCECTSGDSGCSPTKVDKQISCVMTSCSTCKKSNSISTQGGSFTEMIIINPGEVSFFSDASELEGRLVLPGEFYNMPLIAQRLEEIEANLNPSNNPSDRKLIPVDIAGYVVFLDVPSDVDNTSPYLNAIGTNANDTKCECIVGSSCPKKSKLIAVWCDASNCKKCQMSGIVSNPEGTSYELRVSEGRIAIDN